MKLIEAHKFLSLSNGKNLLFGSLPDRLISLVRLLFSAFALLAIYLDPTRPAVYVEEVYGLLCCYVIFSVLMVYISSVRTFQFPVQIVIHLIDIAIPSLAVFLTDGVDSPFFTIFSFTLFTATMRWGWRGAFSTATALAVLFIVVSWEDIEFNFGRDSHTNLLVMRGVYLFATAAMLGYFGAYMDRSRRRLSRLAAWPIEDKAAMDWSSTIGPLRHAQTVLGARVVLVLWQDHATRRRRIAYWHDHAAEVDEADTNSPWANFVLEQNRAVFYSHQKKVRTVAQESLELFLSRIDQQSPGVTKPLRSYALAPFNSRHFFGCVVVVDPRYHSEDIVSLVDIVAARIGSDLERETLAAKVADAAIMQERVRLARDMHDSVLQDLAAASLMLKSATAGVGGQQSEPLKEIGWLLTSQQKRIRTFVETTNAAANAAQSPLAEPLDVLLSTLERQWRCKLSMTIAPPDLLLESSTTAEIIQLISEATANAVRHGHAGQVHIHIAASGGDLHIRIEDNGSGLPLDDKGVVRVEPNSIRRRVSDLAGTLSLVCTTNGTQLSIRIPA